MDNRKGDEGGSPRKCADHADMKRTAWQHIKKIIGVAITPGRKVSDAEARVRGTN